MERLEQTAPEDLETQLLKEGGEWVIFLEMECILPSPPCFESELLLDCVAEASDCLQKMTLWQNVANSK